MANTREELKRQRENWMRQRELEKDREDVVRDIQSSHQRTSSAEAYQPELVDKLFVKMSERLEQKLHKVGPSKPKQSAAQSSKDYEASLHNQVMSNTCPICFELFLPPLHQPFILFPCGHTFCKDCIEKYAKVKKKCPFCRNKYNSMAPNISLQNLILSANDKKEEVVKQLQQKQEQMIQNQQFSSGVARTTLSNFPGQSYGLPAAAQTPGQSNSTKMPNYSQQSSQQPQQQQQQVPQMDLDKYISDYRMLEIRTSVMHEELSSAHTDAHQSQQQLLQKQKGLTTLGQEKQDCLERLKKVQRELELIEEFEQKEEEDLRELKDKQKKAEQSQKFIESSLKPLEQEKQKVEMLLQSFGVQASQYKLN